MKATAAGLHHEHAPEPEPEGSAPETAERGTQCEPKTDAPAEGAAEVVEAPAAPKGEGAECGTQCEPKTDAPAEGPA